MHGRESAQALLRMARARFGCRGCKNANSLDNAPGMLVLVSEFTFPASHTCEHADGICKRIPRLTTILFYKTLKEAFPPLLPTFLPKSAVTVA
eukprot:6203026-Pleurochrysis_carterae.AAC.2